MVLLAPRAAHAQYLPDYFPSGVPGYDQDRGVAIISRTGPQYFYSPLDSAPGVRVGGFTIRPTLGESMGVNTNVTGVRGGPGSWLIETNPGILVQSDWSRGTLGGLVSVDNFYYPQAPRQNQTDWEAALGGSYTIGDGDLGLAYAHLSAHELPTDIGAPPTSTPLPFTVDDARIKYTFDLGRLKIIPNLEYQHWQYGETTFVAMPGQADQAFRDHNVIQGGPTLRYELSGRTNLVLDLQGSTSQYLESEPVSGAPSLSSNSALALTGIDYQYSGVVRYQLLAGIEKRTFQAAKVGNRASPIFQGAVIWTPTALTTVTANAVRTIEDPTAEGTSGFFYNRAQIRVDHAYLRDVSFDGEAEIAAAEYIGGGTQTGYSFGTGVTWALNSRLHLSAHYEFTERSSGPAISVLSPSGSTTVLSGGAYNQSLFLIKLIVGL